jgi:hypothetical protein
MNELDRIAQQFPKDGERALADYFVAVLPCQLLLLDALTIERRRLPTPTEFVLKAIHTGVGVVEDIAGLLGMTSNYADKLVTGLRDDGFLLCDEIGRLQLTKKGINVLEADGERRPIDKTVPFLWDPVLQGPIQHRPILLTQKAAELLGPVWKMPNIFRQPSLVDLAKADCERFANAQQEGTDARESNEIIKFLSVKRCLYRYRPVLVLVYEKEGAAPIFKVAIDGQIDDELSTSLAQRDGGKYIGIDAAFSRKAGALAVKERSRQLKLSGNDKDGIELAEIMRRKSTLLFSSAVLQERIAEEATDSLKQKLAERVEELRDVERLLSKAQIIPLMQFEVGLALESALDCAEDLLITTTLPNVTKMTAQLQVKFENFLANGGKAWIYIAGRPNDGAMKDGEARILGFFNKLQESYKALSVHFLRKVQRPVFEIRSGRRMTFSNEPPLGRRVGEFSPRAFRGYELSHPTSVDSYSAAHLNFDRDDLLMSTSEKR